MINGIFQSTHTHQHRPRTTACSVPGKMSFIYTNLNKPIKKKLEVLVTNFPTTDFFLISEIDEDVTNIDNLADIPIGYRIFHHEAVRDGDDCKINAMIMVRSNPTFKIKIKFRISTIHINLRLRS